MPVSEEQAKNVASVLTEALPYIREFQGWTIVIKYGGNAMLDAPRRQSFAHDVTLMKLVGVNPVVVHGGAPQIGGVLEKLGKESVFIDGMRVTDSETMDVVEMVLGGIVNKEIVQMISAQGGRAVGITGKDGNLIRARKLHAPAQSGGVDYGHVGEVESIDARVVELLQQRDFIPVVAPIGAGKDGQTYNINADLVAGKMAVVLGAEKLILMTNTGGVQLRDGKLAPELNAAAIGELLRDGVIKGGMIPKVECALDAVRHGVNTALIIDGRAEHALLLELFTDAGVGTMISA